MAKLLHKFWGVLTHSSHAYHTTAAMASRLPLQGINVVEFPAQSTGPFCGKVLSDFGASVIRVDKPAAPEIDRLSAGKRSIVVNQKSPKGLDVVRKLCQKADVLIDPFRPGVMEKLSLGPADLHPTNPGLIYVRITGYGQTGPMAAVAGHDINCLGMSGVLSLLGRKESVPTPPQNLLAAFGGGGLMAAFGVTMALLDRTKTGKGQVIDCSMTEGTAYLSSFLFAFHDEPPVFGNGRGSNWLDSGSHFYDSYETSDGRYMAVGAVEPKFYYHFVTKLGLDPEQVGQFENWESNKDLIRQQFLKKPFDHWCKVFEGSDACVTPVLSLDEAPSSSLHRDREAFSSTRDTTSHILPNPAPRLSLTPAAPSHRGNKRPEMGEQTREILAQLGYEEGEIATLIEEGVVEQSEERVAAKL